MRFSSRLREFDNSTIRDHERSPAETEQERSRFLDEQIRIHNKLDIVSCLRITIVLERTWIEFLFDGRLAIVRFGARRVRLLIVVGEGVRGIAAELDEVVVEINRLVRMVAVAVHFRPALANDEKNDNSAVDFLCLSRTAN